MTRNARKAEALRRLKKAEEALERDLTLGNYLMLRHAMYRCAEVCGTSPWVTYQLPEILVGPRRRGRRPQRRSSR